MSELRDAAQAVVSQAEADDNFDGEFIDYLVPFEAIDALRAALSGVPEGAASDPCAVVWKESPAGQDRWCETHGRWAWRAWRCDAAQQPASPSPEPLDVQRLATALHAMPHHYRGGADDDLARMACQQMSPSACEHKAASIAREYARLAAPQPVPEDET